MRIILFGTGPFAVPSFTSLLDANHEVAALVTRPISDSGKRRKSAENPTRDLGLSRNITIFDPANCNAQEFVKQLSELQADLFVVCDYGQILSRPCLSTSRLGGINLHGSLLPKYRGAAPINWAIYHGEQTTGVTIIHMTPKLDGGPCLVSSTLDIDPHETADELEPRLAQLGIAPVNQAIEMLANWDGAATLGQPQAASEVTQAPRLKKSDGLIDWSQSANQICNQIRAFQPWPGSYSHWQAKHLKQPLRVIIHQASAEPNPHPTDVQPGHVVISTKNQLLIQTAAGQLAIKQIQPAGKRPMPVADFLRGHQPKVGDTFA